MFHLSLTVEISMRPVVVLASLLISALACGGSSDSTAPIANIAGSYMLQSANGHALPATGTVPIYGSVQVTSGSDTTGSDGSASVTINAILSSVSNVTTGSYVESGTVRSNGGGSYTFSFVDGTRATANCAAKTCNVTDGANTYVFVRL